MNIKYQPGQQVYFLICGRYVTKAAVVTSSSCFVTIRFSKKKEDCVIRLPYSRIFSTAEEARQHIRPDLPPILTEAQNNKTDFICMRRWKLWE